MQKIKNRQQLIDQGKNLSDRQFREIMLLALEDVLVATAPETLIKTHLAYKQGVVSIMGQHYSVANYERILVVGAGKAGYSMAGAIEEIFGDKIDSGLINIPEANGKFLRHICINQASHPLPDQSGMAGATKMLNLANSAGKNDLVFCLLSGGGSSLLPLPADSISLFEKQEISNKLLISGASICEINTVRKHISAIKGGQLARALWPATTINLILSDVIADPLEVIASGPTIADPTTFSDARHVLEKYQLLADTPDSIKKRIEAGISGSVADTPKSDDPIFERVNNFIIGNNNSAKKAACTSLAGSNLRILDLEEPFQCNSEEAARLIVQKAIEVSRQMGSAPIALIGGGETTVKVSGSGQGGRAQHLALAFAIEAEKMRLGPYLFTAFATDGIDGPTDAAGALISNDRINFEQAQSFLESQNSYNFFKTSESLLSTGYTGTNVNDIYILILL